MEKLELNSLSLIFANSFQELANQLVIWLPKLIVALLIWWTGRFLLNLAARGVKKIDIPGTKIDNRMIAKFNKILLWLGKAILLLIVLDYLGIGRTIISALANGLTLTIALALGIAFGQALRPEAEKMVREARKTFKKQG